MIAVAPVAAAVVPAAVPKLVITSMDMPAIVAVTINSSSESKKEVKSNTPAVIAAPAATKVEKRKMKSRKYF